MPRRSTFPAVAATLAMLLGAAQAATAQQAAPAARGLIDKRAVLARATWLDNRDTDWYLANAPFIDTPDKAIDDTFLYRIELMTKHIVYARQRMDMR